MLRAAALADLHREGRLTDERGRPAVDARRPCHDPVLGAVLEEIARAKPHPWQSRIGRRQRAAVREVRQQLDGGWVNHQPSCGCDRSVHHGVCAGPLVRRFAGRR